MTTELTDALDSLAADVDVTPPRTDLATAAWTRGRRARTRARASRVALAAAAVVTVVAAVLPGSWDRSALPSSSRETSSTGYPVRITKPWTTEDLPLRGEPLAGVLLSEARGYTGWYAVTKDGDLRRLPVSGGFMRGNVPTLSDDGRLIGYVDSSSGQYVLHDVVSGRVTSFPDVRAENSTDPQAEAPAPYRVGPQIPGYVSPDGVHVAVPGTTGTDGTTAILVLGTDGSVRPVAVGGEDGLVGWLDDQTLLTMNSKDSGPDDAGVSTLTPVAIGLDGTTRRLPTLRPSEPVAAFSYSQWSPALSPDHRSLAMGLSDHGRPSSLVFDLADGREVESRRDSTILPGSPTVNASTSGMKHIEWAGSTWYGVLPGPAVRAMAPQSSTDDPAIVVDPRLDTAWLDLADDALSGPAHGNVLGTADTWVAWHWREVLIAAGVLILVALGLHLTAGRSQQPVRRSPTRPRGPDRRRDA
ncbi:hypothetical protein GCM10009867_27130 [Pedococcus aerophilus]|uniref:WD40 repeat domain-containing protein n=1 Tax=Pedococcus aerophilus TaxID=436356 RepID=A0ABP6H7K3_9MICO